MPVPFFLENDQDYGENGGVSTDERGNEKYDV